MSDTSVNVEHLQKYFDAMRESNDGDSALVVRSTKGASEVSIADEAKVQILPDEQNLRNDAAACFIDDSGNMNYSSSAAPTPSTAATDTTANFEIAESQRSVEMEMENVFIACTDRYQGKQSTTEAEEVNADELFGEEIVDGAVFAIEGPPDARPFKCDLCQRGFKTKATRAKHAKLHLGIKPHVCESCGKRFTTLRDLQRHIQYRHTSEKPHKCTECDYSCVELYKLRRHMTCHTGIRPYQCAHCTYAAVDSFYLKRHMRIHTGEKPYKCDICLATFNQTNGLKSHLRVHGIADRPLFRCSLCSATFAHKANLSVHERNLHQSDRPIKSKVCDQQLPDLHAHQVHEGERGQQCAIRPPASAVLRQLHTNTPLQTDQKRFECQHCDASFREPMLLTRHMNSHHNKDSVPPKPRKTLHSCPHCHRAFIYNGCLRRHLEKHAIDSNAQQRRFNIQMGGLTRIQGDHSNATITSGALYSDNTTTTGYEGDAYDIIGAVNEDMDETYQQLCDFMANVDEKEADRMTDDDDDENQPPAYQ